MIIIEIFFILVCVKAHNISLCGGKFLKLIENNLSKLEYFSRIHGKFEQRFCDFLELCE